MLNVHLVDADVLGDTTSGITHSCYIKSVHFSIFLQFLPYLFTTHYFAFFVKKKILKSISFLIRVPRVVHTPNDGIVPQFSSPLHRLSVVHTSNKDFARGILRPSIVFLLFIHLTIIFALGLFHKSLKHFYQFIHGFVFALPNVILHAGLDVI